MAKEERFKLGGYVEGETVDNIKVFQEKYKEIFGTRATQGMIIDFLVKHGSAIFEEYEKVSKGEG